MLTAFLRMILRNAWRHRLRAGLTVLGMVFAPWLADLLTSGWDQNAFNEALSPAAIAFEDVAGRWLKEALGLPAAASVGFVTGAQGANTVGLAAGRHHVLAEAGYDAGAVDACAEALHLFEQDRTNDTVIFDLAVCRGRSAPAYPPADPRAIAMPRRVGRGAVREEHRGRQAPGPGERRGAASGGERLGSGDAAGAGGRCLGRAGAEAEIRDRKSVV